jgi:hypothetical protein
VLGISDVCRNVCLAVGVSCATYSTSFFPIRCESAVKCSHFGRGDRDLHSTCGEFRPHSIGMLKYISSAVLEIRTHLLHAMTKASSWWALSFFFLFALHAHWRRESLFANPAPPTHSVGSWPTHSTQDPLAWSLHTIQLITYELRSRCHNQSAQEDHTTSRLSQGMHREQQWVIS